MNWRRKFREIGSWRTCTWPAQTTKMCRTQSSCKNLYTLSQGLSRNFVRIFVLQNLSTEHFLRAGFHCGSAAPLLRGTWLHVAEQRGSTDTRHSRYRGRAPHFLMTFHLTARAKSKKFSCSGLRNELKFEF